VQADYGQQYRDLYQRHWWWRAREHVVLDTLAAHRPMGGLHRILDIGCGDGLFFDALLRLDGVELVEGVETDASIVSPNGRHRDRIHVVPFDARFNPGRRYSAILMLDVLEHLPEPEAALRHALALLEPGGVLIATVPAFPALWTRHDELNHHYRRYTRRTFTALAATAGMHISEIRYFFHWTVAAKLATRVVERLVPGQPQSPQVPPAPINAALYGIARAEELLLGRARLPLGTSLLVVGESSDQQL
jgi:SAM-dependent methyltransferase